MASDSVDWEHITAELAKIDDGWKTARFDSLPYVVHILTSKDREGEIEDLKERSNIIEDVVDEVVHGYHNGFNKAIHNYSQVGALQDVRSELSKLRGILFFKVVEDLHNHLYNKGEYSSNSAIIHEKDDDIPIMAATGIQSGSLHPVSRRTRTMRRVDHQGDSSQAADGLHRPVSVDGSSSFEGREDESVHTGDNVDGGASDGLSSWAGVNGNEALSKEFRNTSRRMPRWLSNSTPNEFIEAMRKNDAPLNVKYLQTMAECLSMLGKIAAAGAIISQRLRPTVHEIITSEIKAKAAALDASRPRIDQVSKTAVLGLKHYKGTGLASYKGLVKSKHQNGRTLTAAQSAVGPVSPSMAPMGAAQVAAQELLESVLDMIIRILGGDGIRPGRGRRSSTVAQEGYGTGTVLSEQGIYLTASVYRPVLQFTDKVASLLPPKYAQLGMANNRWFIHLAGPAAFRPRAHPGAVYDPSVEKGRPVLQGLLAIDHLGKEVLGWAQAMPKYAGDLVEYVQTFLERTYERCRTSYMEENLIRDDHKLVLLAALSDSLEYVADSIEKRTSSALTASLASLADQYRNLAVECLRVLRIEMQLETLFHLQDMTSREYIEDQDAEEPEDFIVSLIAQITRRDEEMAPYISETKRNYIFGGICSISATAIIKALNDMKSINLFGTRQICRNCIALEQYKWKSQMHTNLMPHKQDFQVETLRVSYSDMDMPLAFK